MSGTGLDAQLGIKTETTFGTAVTVDSFFPIKSESITEAIDQLVSEAIIPGRMLRDTDQVKQGMRHVAGSIELDLYEQNCGRWLYHLLGANANAGGGPYTHTLTPGTRRDLGFTLQKGVPSVDGTVNPWTIAGCKVASATLSAEVGSPLSLKVDIIGTVTATTGESLATASFVDNAAVPMSWADASATVDGNSVAAQAWELSVNGNLPERPLLGRNISAEPLASERFEVSGKITTEFEDTTEQLVYRNGSIIDVVLDCDDGTHSLDATIKTMLSGVTPAASGPGVVAHDLTWSNAFGDASDTNGFNIVVVDDQSDVA